MVGPVVGVIDSHCHQRHAVAARRRNQASARRLGISRLPPDDVLAQGQQPVLVDKGAPLMR